MSLKKKIHGILYIKKTPAETRKLVIHIPNLYVYPFFLCFLNSFVAVITRVYILLCMLHHLPDTGISIIKLDRYYDSALIKKRLPSWA